ncbi:MAG: helix-turn-helix domain-containing protein [Phycisphaerales bacterium JB038]
MRHETAAGMVFDELVSGGWSAVERLVAEGREESLHLEFKRKSEPNRADLGSEDKRNLAKALSGFANADGGVLVWGMCDDEADRADRTEPINEVEAFANRLRSLLPEMVETLPAGIRLSTILKPAGDGSGVAILLVPRSDETPHMACAAGQRTYYRRAERAFLPMHHHEVADLFGRRPRPTLSVDCSFALDLRERDGTCFPEVSLEVLLSNAGRAVASHAAVSAMHAGGWDVRPSGEAFGVQKPAPVGASFRFLAGSDTKIYPKDRLLIGRINATIAKQVEPPDLRLAFTAVAEGAAPTEHQVCIPGTSIAALAREFFVRETRCRQFSWWPAKHSGPYF